MSSVSNMPVSNTTVQLNLPFHDSVSLVANAQDTGQCSMSISANVWDTSQFSLSIAVNA